MLKNIKFIYKLYFKNNRTTFNKENIIIFLILIKVLNFK
jgi:hypothetical protein